MAKFFSVKMRQFDGQDQKSIQNSLSYIVKHCSHG